jgi:hypothetical protein
MSSSRHSSHARSRASRHTPSSAPYVPQPESLILPDGPVGEEAAELLAELVHHHHEDTLTPDADDDDIEDAVARRHLPWWKRPSPWW